MKIIRMSQPVYEIQLGIPPFSGPMDIVVVRNGLKSFKRIQFVNGEAKLPRGYQAVEDGNGYTIQKPVQREESLNG